MSTTTVAVLLTLLFVVQCVFIVGALLVVRRFWQDDRVSAQVQREELVSMVKSVHGALLRVKGKPQGVMAGEGAGPLFPPPRPTTPRRNGAADFSRDTGILVS